MHRTDEHLPNAYLAKIDRLIEFDSHPSTPTLSVVIVTYRIDEDDLATTLDALDAQTINDFEVVIVDNGGHDDLEGLLRAYRVRWYAKLRENCGVTFGRNLGAELARGDPLIFLDDDGVPKTDFVEAHTRIHHDCDIVAARGKVLPRTETVYNDLYTWYDLGTEAFPCCINIEGNSSFDANVFERLGGFDEALGGRAGHEGIELTYRIVEAGHGREEIIYHPDAVIYHDGATTLRSYVEKRLQRKVNRRLLSERYPNLVEFTTGYNEPTEPDRSNANRIDRVRLRAAEAIVEAADLVQRRVHNA